MCKTLVASLVTAILAAPGYASAQQYIGVSGGVTRTNSTSNDLAEQLSLLGYQVQGQDTDRTDQSFRLFMGHRLHKNLAVELGVGELGKVNVSIPVLPNGSLKIERETRFIDLSLVGSVPITNTAELFARLGAQRTKVDARYAAEGDVTIFDSQASQEVKQTRAVAAIGLNWGIASNASFRLEASRSNKIGSDLTLGKASATSVTAGILYQFSDLFPRR